MLLTYYFVTSLTTKYKYSFSIISVVVKGRSRHTGAFSHLKSYTSRFEKQVKSWGGEPIILTAQNKKQNDPMDQKVIILSQFLNSTKIKCLFVIDISDVRILQSPEKLCRSNKLYIATDVCDTKNVKKWMQNTYLKGSHGWSNTLVNHLYNYTTPLWNAGIFGGRIGTLRPFIYKYSENVLKHMSKNNRYPVDMLAYNEVVESYPRTSIETGFPLGILNAPMWGNTCCNKKYSPCYKNCSSECTHSAIRKGGYFFSHKFNPRKKIF
jgi:hypothetical protein